MSTIYGSHIIDVIIIYWNNSSNNNLNVYSEISFWTQNIPAKQ